MTTERLTLGDLAVELTVRAGGPEQVAFLHASPFQCWFDRLVQLLDGVSTLRYQRIVAPGAEFDIEDDADAVLAMLHHAGFEHAHLVGHSYGGLLALELARRAPAATRSLALLEPASSGFVEEERALAGLAPLLELARAAGPAAAMGKFLDMVVGEGSDGLLQRHVPGGMDAVAEHAEQFFRVELPAVVRWSYGADDAAAVTQPVLNVVGTLSVPRFVETAELLQSWFPRVERFELAGAGTS